MDENQSNYYFHLIRMDRYFNFYYWKIFAFTIINIGGSIVLWYGVMSLVCGFFIYSGSQKFLEYRFTQLTQRIKEEQGIGGLNAARLMQHIGEHDYLVRINERNKSVMSLALMIVYYCFTPTLDFLYFNIIYSTNSLWFVRATVMFATMICTLFLYAFAYSSACLYQAAHSPYKLLNSILAKNTRDGEFRFPYRKKLKISFYLERFSGPEITNWCWVLFPLTSYAFYEFVAAVASNFFLIVSFIR